MTDQTLDPIAGTDPVRWPAMREMLASAALILGQTAAAGRESTVLAAELIRIGLGRSEVGPAKGDRRFDDPAWQHSRAFHQAMQCYLASCRAVDNLLENLEDLDYRHATTARFLAGIATSAAAPTNYLPGNPAALKRALDTGGTSLARGVRNWLTDVRTNGGMPSTVKRGQLVVSRDLAVTPGAVVARDEVAELLQYAPATDTVRERPTLVIPPPIGRYYFLDLAPGRSFVEHAVKAGIQTFMLSWRNPTKDQSDWSLGTYAGRVLSAVDEVREITGQDSVNLIGFCAGGILSAVALNRLAASGERRVHSASYAVTLLDFGGENPINTFSSLPVLSLAKWSSKRKGVIDARAMGSAFTWMRPNDLVWNYWVNNYLMGEDPPVFDILAWNADGTSLPARLHAEFLDIFGKNPLPMACARTYLDAPLDLRTIDVPTFVVGARNDHLTPWRGTYRTTELTSGPSMFVLSNAGHIASLVNPPGNPKASFLTGPAAGEVDADTWHEGAVQRPGSWWEAWAAWTLENAGADVPAPATLGSRAHPPMYDAPGRYVHDET